MQTSIEEFKTGWHGVTIGLKKAEIDSLIKSLQRLRDRETDHFHGRSTFERPSGIADIEFHIASDDATDDVVFDFSNAIEPTR